MTKLTAEIKACGLCANCGAQQVTAISEKEAREIVKVCKFEMVKAVSTAYQNLGDAYTSKDLFDDVIQAIQNVE